eukprot:CAMPEP_0206209992 /NCGR_PEP_ID=MMETSP0166-20121206/17256_1 /ASSEMBLY_ACC=CAM_ASM_000260 /TAXON_ID=95228 /ORGANISM="Vannella robusta, Strain DIVA3 518/3/11/1/6" /LENGTH=154 /DNA_ID=CAMNT_0053631529 /DNA_START=297 /DNA_END=761 /DNA_ORIENTATION=+
METSVRVREHFYGESKGSLTLDVRGNYHHVANADPKLDQIFALANIPLQPVAGVISIDTLEEGYHVCDSKYTREMRLVLPQETELNTCADVSNLFLGMKVTNPRTPLRRTPSAMWLVWKHHGFMHLDELDVEVEVESTFALQYRGSIFRTEADE